jgi:hypothetical protein
LRLFQLCWGYTMNRSSFPRLVWKEFRLQRSLWIAMAVLIVMVQALVVALVNDPHDVQTALFWVAFALPVFYALGSGAMAFCGEHEAETYDFQRALPLGAGKVFWGKIGFSLAGIAPMFAAMALLAFVLDLRWGAPLAPSETPEHPLPPRLLLEGRVLLAGSLCLLGLEMYLWATLFSLILRHVLVAAVFAVLVASWIYNSLVPLLLLYPEERILATLPLRLAIVGLLAIANYWLGVHWFDERSERGRFDELSTAAKTSRTTTRRSGRPSRTAILTHLVWQQWRQTRVIMLALLAWFVPIAITCLVAAYHEWRDPHYFSSSDRGAPFTVSLLLSLPLALIGIPQFGLCAFMGDQWRQGYRCLAAQGVPPRYVWWSRQLVSVVLPAALFFACLFVLCLCPPLWDASEFMKGLREVQIWAGYWGSTQAQPGAAQLFVYAVSLLAVFAYVVLSLSAGQFCSMFLRSSLLGAFASVILTAIVTAWCAAMLYFGVPLVWSVLPVPVILLLATRLRTAGWMTERNDLRAWLLPGAVLVVPIAALLIGVPLYRAFEIPAVDPGFALADYTRPMTDEEKANLAAYQLIPTWFSSVRPPEGKTFSPQEYQDAEHRAMRAWVKANQKTVDLAMKASQLTVYVPVNQKIEMYDPALTWLLTESATVLEENGKLDEALEQYLAAIRIEDQLVSCGLSDRPPEHTPRQYSIYDCLISWAARPKQTPERILAAVRRLGELPPVSDRAMLVRKYLRAREFLISPQAFLEYADSWQPTPATDAFLWIWTHLPWERARALRLLNVLMRSELDVLSNAEQDERENLRVWEPFGTLPERFVITGPYTLQTDINVPPLHADIGPHHGASVVRQSTPSVCIRRAACLSLALAAWRLQHGSLPAKLDELVGPCLDSLPMDPYSGEAFRYFPQGIGMQLSDQFSRDSRWGGQLPANVPFIWSTGEPERSITIGQMTEIQYAVDDGTGSQSLKPMVRYDFWSRGLAFPIPKPASKK